MAAIGAIRKHGILLMCIIGLALLAFVIGDVSKLSGLFSDQYTMVKIDGKKLDDDYRIRLEQNTALWKIFYEKTNLDETEIYQVHDLTWSQILDQTILENQLDNLGLNFTKEMKAEVAEKMNASLQSENPNQLLYRLVSFLAQQVSIEEAISFISNIEDYKDNAQVRDLYLSYKAIERFALIDAYKLRYSALSQNSINFSDAAAKYFATQNKSMMAQVMTLHPDQPQFDELVPTITDTDIKTWFKQNKNRYFIKNDTRNIDVAVFPIRPSASDLQTIQDTAMNRADRMKHAASLEDFNLSLMYGQVDSTYYKRTDIQIDTIAKMLFDKPIGTFIEPFMYEEAVWYYGKTYGIAKRPDSVHVAYLVVDFKTERNPNSTRTKAIAKKEADSLQIAIQKGSNIFKMIPSYLGGRSAGDTTLWVSERSTFPQLYNELLSKSLYVQDAAGGYVIYQVLQRTIPIEKRQFLLYTEEIKPSDATVKTIRNEANQLRSECETSLDLTTNAAQKGVQMLNGKDITSMTASISGLQNAREIISWAFNPETKLDAVSDVYQISNSVFAVATVSDLKKKGEPKLAAVKETIETELKAIKKMEMVETYLNEQIKAGSTLAQLAEKYQVQIQDSATLIFGGEMYQNRNIENNAIGKIFGMSPNTVAAVSGKASVYMVSVYGIEEAAAPSPQFAMEKSMLKNVTFGRSRNENTILEGLKDKAIILDQRHLHFAR